MSWLLYGIAFSRSGDHASGHSALGLPVGVGGGPVRVIEEGGLAAAVSWAEPPDLTPNVARVLAYGKVVEALHANRAVLPMRYGCVFAEGSQVVELLSVHGEEYAAALRGLDGYVEMGVRLLLPAGSVSEECEHAPSQAGSAYLIGRAVHYAREEEAVRGLAAVMEQLRGALGGLAKRIETDCGARADRGLGSLYFLVKREAVESFRQAFRRIERAEPARLLLSGPWAPYNFVATEGRGTHDG